MTKQEQTKLIESFLNSMKKDLLDKVEKLPENWDGWEIKHWIAEKFDSVCLYLCIKKIISIFVLILFYNLKFKNHGMYR